MGKCTFFATLAGVSALSGVALAAPAEPADTDDDADDASEEPAPAAETPEPNSELAVHAYPGAFYILADPREGNGGGALVGVEAAYRHGNLVGATFLEGGLGFPMFASAGLAAGVGFHTTPGPRVDLLLAGGVDYYLWGAGFLSDDPGVTVALPFAGPRVRAAYAFRAGPRHFEMGALFAWEINLTRAERTYSYTERPWLCFDSCQPYTTEAHHVVGGSRAMLALTFGGSFDFQ